MGELHELASPARPLRRLHGEPDPRLGHPAGPPDHLDAPRAISAAALFDPRPRQQVHTQLRHRLPQRGHRDRPDTGARPKANAVAERFVRTARSECLDWLLNVNRRHLDRVLRVFVDHCNRHRRHRSLKLAPPDPSARTLRAVRPPTAGVKRRDRLGGLLHEYRSPLKPSLRTPQVLAAFVALQEPTPAWDADCISGGSTLASTMRAYATSNSSRS